jgi:hypothetical protein
VFAGLYRVAPGVLDALKILEPQTVIRWHRAGFRAYWRWKSRPHGGRPKTPAAIRQLIREMSVANPLWGAPRIHGERAQAWDRCRADHGGKIHGKEEGSHRRRAGLNSGYDLTIEAGARQRRFPERGPGVIFHPCVRRYLVFVFPSQSDVTDQLRCLFRRLA